MLSRGQRFIPSPFCSKSVSRFMKRTHLLLWPRWVTCTRTLWIKLMRAPTFKTLDERKRSFPQVVEALLGWETVWKSHMEGAPRLLPLGPRPGLKVAAVTLPIFELSPRVLPKLWVREQHPPYCFNSEVLRCLPGLDDWESFGRPNKWNPAHCSSACCTAFLVSKGTISHPPTLA